MAFRLKRMPSSYRMTKGKICSKCIPQSSPCTAYRGSRLPSLAVPKKKFHVKVMDVGGGFGSKGGPSYPWPLLACLFARKTGLPIKWTASRTEEFLESAAGRDEYCDVTLACDQDGRMVALRAMVECDVGVSGTQTHMPSLTIWTMPGPYNIPNLDSKVAAYVTNKMPIGPVRGAGAPEGCYFIERVTEIMAKKIGLDPVEFRRRNLEKPSKLGQEDYQVLLDTLVKSSNYDALLKWRHGLFSKFRQESSDASSVLAGIGIFVRGSSESEDEEEDWGGEGEEFQDGGERRQNCLVAAWEFWRIRVIQKRTRDLHPGREVTTVAIPLNNGNPEETTMVAVFPS